MPRVKLKPQPIYAFQHTLTVRVTDLNYGAHLANDALVGLLAEARVHLLRALGCTETDLGDGQTGIIMADLLINFRSEGFLFDTLRIESHIGDVTRKSFRIFYRVCRAEEPLALAETGMVAFNYIQREPVVLPEQFKRALSQYQLKINGDNP